MKPIRLQNEFGETIEVKWDADGNIQIRHSDINKHKFGQFHEYAEEDRQPQVEEYLKQKGIDPNSPQAKELLPKMGGYLVIQAKTYSISAAETAMVLQAIKQHGGIISNWSSQA